MKVYVAQRPGRRNYGIFSTLDKAKEAVGHLLVGQGYEPDDYHWDNNQDYVTCYSDLYRDQPENDLFKVVAVELDTITESAM